MGKKKVLLISGLISGGVFILSWVGFHLAYVAGKEEFDFGSGEALGYLTMIIALSTVYFGVRNYRDKQLNGEISFKQAFFSGMIIVLIGSVIYVISWMVYYSNFLPDFADMYMNSQIESYQSEGMDPGELDRKINELKAFNEMYKKPLVMAGITFMEVFPVGLLITIISALLLRKKVS